ncbi:MAG TPA: hypothetical protein VK157_09765 [Phycisphaerales bacterium]|nr:hypothetical protein [Phycisphaerales bacterium]
MLVRKHSWSLGTCLLALAGVAAIACIADARQEKQPEKPAAKVAVEQRETELTLKDGQKVTGVLISQDAANVVLSIQGVPTTFAMNQVARLTELPTIEERYQRFRANTPDEDVEGLLKLSRWLHERKRYDLALKEVERALKAEPDHPGANQLKIVLTEQLKLEGMGPALPVTPKEPRERVAVPLDAMDSFPLLSDEQINLIRVFEVDLKDPPRMLVPRAAVEQFMDKYAGQLVEGRGQVPTTPEGREQFLRQKPAEILAWFFDLRAREFYDRVQVEENPRAMRSFINDVHRTWLVNSCATTKCHGGEEAGRLFLYTRKPNSPRSAYTNFLILDRYRTAEGQGLIDYAQPARSPLLHMGLPRNKAIFKHPEVKGLGRVWKPIFDSEDDPNFRAAVNWIQSMFETRAGYPIEYTPPVPGPLKTEATDRTEKPAEGEKAPPR